MTSPSVPPAPQYQPVPVGGRTNVLAIVGFILAFFVTAVGAVLSGVALGQIKRTGEAGHGLALAGLILGIVFSVLWIIYFIILIIAGIATASLGSVYSGYTG